MANVPRLVYITDRRSSRLPIPEAAASAVDGGVDLVQVREKDLPERELRRLVEQVINRVGDARLVAVNGSPDVARELGVRLHMPESMPTPTTPANGLSRSVHTPERAERSGDCDFLIAGHVFPTGSKPGLPPIGIAGLVEIVRAAPCPVLAIGGMTPDRVADVIAAGAVGVAVLSAINAAPDPAAAARPFTLALEAAMSSQVTAVHVVVNGKPTTVEPGITIEEFLKQRGHHDRMVVVELNGTIIRRAGFPSTTISAGDRIEIVHFVGGG